ncbi:MAG: hydantoinase/carbamoylase family amidase [Pseudomonadota bacterium]
MISIEPDRLLADLRELATFGSVDTGVHRLSLTEADIAARHWLVQRMTDAGLDAQIDGLGNVYGETPEASRTVLIGSHTDTVPKGGWLDGAMGVIYGVEIARALLEAGVDRPAGAGVDVISFIDEEGHFQGTTGSLAFCNEFDPETDGDPVNADGVSFTQALTQAGFAGRPIARVDATRHAAFLEAHIEQGPRLEQEDRRIGIVTGIVGIRRIRMVFAGQADHAGTTPMELRRDASAVLIDCLYDLRQRFEALAAENTVWNCGFMRIEPGAPNVVAESAEAVVEFRDLDPAVLERLAEAVHEAIHAATAATDGKVTAETAMTLEINPANMSPDIGRKIEAASRTLDTEPIWMPSGAGHDAMILARHVPSGMLFIPSIGGRSHHTAEDTSEADIVLGAQVLAGTVERLLRTG